MLIGVLSEHFPSFITFGMIITMKLANNEKYPTILQNLRGATHCRKTENPLYFLYNSKNKNDKTRKVLQFLKK